MKSAATILMAMTILGLCMYYSNCGKSFLFEDVAFRASQRILLNMNLLYGELGTKNDDIFRLPVIIR